MNNNRSFTDKYRPRSLAELIGQPGPRRQLGTWLENPVPIPLLFHGPTGVGKTSAAVALATELGIEVPEIIAEPSMSGWRFLKSGDQLIETVRSEIEHLHMTPMMGKGFQGGGKWRMLVVDEADKMSRDVDTFWASVLESMPARSVIVFTTNHLEKFKERFEDRCDPIEFGADQDAVRFEVPGLIRWIWKQETGDDEWPEGLDLDTLARGDGLSVRRVVRELEKMVRYRRSNLTPPPLRVVGMDEPTTPVMAPQKATPQPKPAPAPLPASDVGEELLDWEVIYAGDVPSLPKGLEPITPSSIRKMTDLADLEARSAALLAHYTNLGRACFNVAEERNVINERMKQIRATARAANAKKKSSPRRG